MWSSIIFPIQMATNMDRDTTDPDGPWAQDGPRYISDFEADEDWEQKGISTAQPGTNKTVPQSVESLLQ